MASHQVHAPAALPSGKNPRTPEPVWRFGEEQNIAPLAGMELGPSVVQPTAQSCAKWSQFR